MPQSRPKVTRTGRVYYSATSVAFRQALTLSCRAAHSGGPVAVPVKVTIEAARQVRGDLDNTIKGILDALVDAQVIPGDTAKQVSHIEAIITGEGPALRIVVESLEMSVSG